MGAILDIRLIDHQRIVVAGLQAVNDALRKNDPEILRSYLGTLAIEVDAADVEKRQSRLENLIEFRVPDVILQAEGRRLGQASGAVYRPFALRKANLDELRGLLATWCCVPRTFSLDKAWERLHWFLEPVSGPVSPLSAVYPDVGDPSQSIWTKALKGATHGPNDDLGHPILGGDPRHSGYNPPETCVTIVEALRRLDPEAFVGNLRFRGELYRLGTPDVSADEVARRLESDLSTAKEAFPVLVAAYAKAVERGFGVSCEYK